MSAEIADFYKNGLHPGTERTAAQKYTPELQTILLKPAIFALRNCWNCKNTNFALRNCWNCKNTIFALRNCCGSDHNRDLISE